MPKGKYLTEFEKGRITSLKESGLSNRKIAIKVRRSLNVVNNYVKKKKNYGIKKSSGRPSVFTERDKRRIIRIASNSALTARQIATEAGVATNVRNVQRLLQREPPLKRMKLKRKPPLKKAHILARLEYARNHVHWNKEWKDIVFYDEKKFNLDGPDGFRYYFHDIRKETKILSRRQQGGGSLMIWGAIGYYGKCDLQFISGKINSVDYVNMLKEVLPAFGRKIAGKKWTFQQDNALIHTAKVVNEWFLHNNIRTIQWPANSPDLNIMENLWGILSREVYSGGKQYCNINELRIAIEDNWRKIDQLTIKNLFDTIPNRIFEVIETSGKHKKY